jgi:hypothetical protein
MAQMRGYRSLFWPLILIGVGVVWLLGNLGVISGANLSVLFRLWPLFLIAIGLDLLIGRNSTAIGAAIGVGTVVLVIILMLVGPGLGWATNVDAQTDTYSAPLGDASRATINLNLGVGESSVYALQDSTNLIDAELKHIGEIDFRVEGETDKVVSLSQRNAEMSVNVLPFFNFGSNFEEDLHWNVGLSPNIALTLSLHGGVGDTQLDLDGLQITSLTLNSGVGAIAVTLPATADTYPVTIKSGVGEAHLTLVEGASVEMSIDGGVGAVTIDVPNDAPLRVEASSGLGGNDLPGNLTRISGNDDHGVWETAGFSGATNPITIHYNGGIGGLTVR